MGVSTCHHIVSNLASVLGSYVGGMSGENILICNYRSVDLLSTCHISIHSGREYCENLHSVEAEQ